jgi:hypothetical protein
MPTYFFDLIKGNELVEDDQGDDFADIEAAKLEGLASARELLADAAKKGILATSPVYLIRNAAGDILATDPLQGRPQTRLRRFGRAEGTLNGSTRGYRGDRLVEYLERSGFVIMKRPARVVVRACRRGKIAQNNEAPVNLWPGLCRVRAAFSLCKHLL